MVKKSYRYKLAFQVHLMTTKAPEETSTENTVDEINWRLKFESWSTFIFSNYYWFLGAFPPVSAPSLPSILALKAIIISASSRQPVARQLSPYSCICCSDAALDPAVELGSTWGKWSTRASLGQHGANSKGMGTHTVPHVLGTGRQNPPQSPPFTLSATLNVGVCPLQVPFILQGLSPRVFMG